LNRTAGLALAAAGAGLFVHSQATRARREHPARGRFIRGLHYLDAGYGAPVALLHGLGSMLEDFELSGVLAQAAQHYRVVAFDRPGYGYSGRGAFTPLGQARLLHEAFLDLGLSRPVLVGHSFGALVAIAYALAYPRHVRGLVLASGYFYPTPRVDAAVLVPPAIPLVGTVLRHTVSPLIGRLLWPAWLKLLFDPLPVPPAFKRLAWRALQPAQLHTVGLESAMLLAVTNGMRRRYSKIRAPSVILGGADDRYVSTRRHSERLHEELRYSTYIEVPGAGHMVHHSAPGMILEAIALASR
jgi:pimeloyl-ACP methyl ester carboxylesterase